MKTTLRLLKVLKILKVLRKKELNMDSAIKLKRKKSRIKNVEEKEHVTISEQHYKYMDSAIKLQLQKSTK